MPATLTNPRVLAKCSLGVAWQTAAGSLASSANAKLIQGYDVSWGPNLDYVMPRGCTGSQYPKDLHQVVSKAPGASFKFYASAHHLSFWLEAWRRGQPDLVNANIEETAGEFVETGDTGNDATGWTFAGFRPGINGTSTGILYVKLLANDPDATTTTVEVYMDVGLTSLVASGTIADASVPGTCTLTEENSSGLSGSVTISNVISADNTGIVLTNAMRTWALTGMRSGFNATASIVYPSILKDTPIPGDVTVNVYKESGRSNLVATGTRTGTGSVTLSESGSSGLSGSVTVNSLPATSNTSIYLKGKKTTYPSSISWDRFFTLFVDDGYKLYTIGDCVVDTFEMSGEDRGVLEVSVRVLGRSFAEGATAITAALDNDSVFAFSGCVFETDVGSGDVTQGPKSWTFREVTKATTHLGSYTQPVAHIPEGVDEIGGTLVFRPHDEDWALFARGLADTADDFKMTATAGDEVLTMTFYKVKWVNPERPNIGQDELADATMNYQCVESSSYEPLLVTLEV